MIRSDTLPRGDALRLIILDCDGVLFDSFEANVAFYDSILTAMGEPPLDERGRDLCHRLSGPQLWDHLYAGNPLHQRAKEIAARADYTPFYALMRPMPALKDTLGRLSTHCPLALATNRGRTVGGVLQSFQLERYFAIRVGILDVPRPKPAPDVLLACLERAAVPAAAAVFVGDTLVDRDAALAAGVPYVGVGEDSGGSRRIRDIGELPALLAIADRATTAP